MADWERRPFEIVIASTGQRILVPERRSALGVLEEHGFRVRSDCRVGICGLCRTKVLAGEAEHWDSVLRDEQRVTEFTPCCSRAKSASLTLDL